MARSSIDGLPDWPTARLTGSPSRWLIEYKTDLLTILSSERPTA